MSSLTENTIVVPWDFSDNCPDALKIAAELAGDKNQIEVVHVTPYPSAVEPAVVWGGVTESDIAEKLESSFREQRPDDDYKFTALFGDPGSEIARFAEKQDASLIVISSHGRKGIPRLLIGSVAERVVRLAPCPVLVLRNKQ